MNREDIHIHVHVSGIEDRLDHIHQALQQIRELIQQTGAETMADLTRLTAEVTENTDAVNSAIALIEGLAQEIRDAGTDPAALAALADQLDASSTALATAVAANTDDEPPA